MIFARPEAAAERLGVRSSERSSAVEKLEIETGVKQLVKISQVYHRPLITLYMKQRRERASEARISEPCPGLCRSAMMPTWTPRDHVIEPELVEKRGWSRSVRLFRSGIILRRFTQPSFFDSIDPIRTLAASLTPKVTVMQQMTPSLT
jgi:hypothetical protein